MSTVTVFVVDVTPGGYPTGTAYVPNRPDVVIVRVNCSNWQPLDIAAEILGKTAEHAGPQGRISQLHLASHGNAGQLLMGAWINASNVTQMSMLGGRLATSGAFGATVLIHGCAVASCVDIEDGCTDRSDPRRPVRRETCFPTLGQAAGPPTGWTITGGDEALRIRSGAGYRFLAAMVRTMRTSVRGAVQAQDVDRVGQSGWRIQGAYMTVGPSGHGSLVDPHGNSGLSSEPGVYQF